MEENRTFQSYKDFENYRTAWEAETFQNFTNTTSKKFARDDALRETPVYQEITFACIHGKERPTVEENQDLNVWTKLSVVETSHNKIQNFLELSFVGQKITRHKTAFLRKFMRIAKVRESPCEYPLP